MSTSEERAREFKQREAELKAKERELRLRELETEIYREQQTSATELDPVEPPLSQTTKHHQEKGLRHLGHKIVKFAKFIGFVVAGVAILKVGFFVGMWITYLLLTGVIAAVGYSIFLKDND